MAGKRTGNRTYIHGSAVDCLPAPLKRRVYIASLRLEDASQAGIADKFFNINFVITHPDHIEFVEAEDFDMNYEPVLGQRYRVDNDGRISYIPRPAKPRVLHQRYKTVNYDYEGFDIKDDMKREKWYRKHFDSRRMSGAGFEHKWLEMLEEIKTKETA